LVRGGALALLLLQPRQAQRRPQLQGLSVLAAGDGEGLMKTGLYLKLVLSDWRCGA
jgi:hypothetical protein